MLLKSNNPFSDGYACERIANILEEKNIKSGIIKIIKGDFMSRIKVKNASGSSVFGEPSCKCETWIEHWKNNSGYQLKDFCRCCGSHVGANKLEGGHVRKVVKKDGEYIVNPNDKSWYIVPLCGDCNKKKENLGVFEVEEAILVSANCSNCDNK